MTRRFLSITGLYISGYHWPSTGDLTGDRWPSSGAHRPISRDTGLLLWITGLYLGITGLLL